MLLIFPTGFVSLHEHYLQCSLTLTAFLSLESKLGIVPAIAEIN